MELLKLLFYYLKKLCFIVFKVNMFDIDVKQYRVLIYLKKKEKYTRSICVLRHSVLPQALSMSLILFLRSSVTSQLSFTQDFSFRNLLETQDQSSNVYLIIYNSINNIIIKRRLYHEGVYPTIVLNCCCEIQ